MVVVVIVDQESAVDLDRVVVYHVLTEVVEVNVGCSEDVEDVHVDGDDEDAGACLAAVEVS